MQILSLREEHQTAHTHFRSALQAVKPATALAQNAHSVLTELSCQDTRLQQVRHRLHHVPTHLVSTGPTKSSGKAEASPPQRQSNLLAWARWFTARAPCNAGLAWQHWPMSSQWLHGLLLLDEAEKSLQGLCSLTSQSSHHTVPPQTMINI